MNFGKVVGTLVLNKAIDSLKGLTFKLIIQTDETGKDIGTPIVAADTVGTVNGDNIFWVTSAEAAFAMPQKFNPVSAAIIGIIDHFPNEGKW